MLKLNELADLKEFISTIEKIKIVIPEDGEITLKELGDKRLKEILSIDKTKISPVYPVVSTALAIRSRESAAIKRKKRFFEKFPEITSLEKLKIVLETTDPRDFLSTYLDIKSNLPDPTQNPKYARLKNLCNGFLEYKSAKNIDSEIDAILDWAEKVDVHQLDNDIIGSKNGIGPATIQNIRLTLKFNEIKGDVNVLNVLKDEVKIIVKSENVDEIASQLGIPKIYLDTLLFEYGKLKQKKKLK